MANTKTKLKIKKGDTVQVISGTNKGKTGKVLNVLPKSMRILIEGVNIRKKHVRASQQNPQGGILSKEAPVHYSNVMLTDAKGKPTRIGFKVEKKDKKTVRTRIARTTGAAV